jgi:hypothetical protein
VLRRIFEPKRDKINKSLVTCALRPMYVIRKIMSRMRCAGHVARMGEDGLVVVTLYSSKRDVSDVLEIAFMFRVEE